MTFAEHVFCDAALALARAGENPAEAVAAARRIQEATGIVPPLGPLPETRWIELGTFESAAKT